MTEIQKLKKSNTIPKDIIKKTKKVKTIPMADDIIKKYLPNSKILLYNELKNYRLENLLPSNKSYFILLFQNSPQEGHWTCLSRYDKNNKTYIEFFDPYGLQPIDILNWLTPEANQELGITDDYLGNMLNEDNDYMLIYNNIKFQSDNGSDINCCGRHVCFRLLNLLKKNLDLTEYQKLMKELKKVMKMNYDDIVSFLIDKY